LNPPALTADNAKSPRLARILETYILILISTVFVNNIVMAKILGLCPFMGVSKKLETAGAGVAAGNASPGLTAGRGLKHHVAERARHGIQVPRFTAILSRIAHRPTGSSCRDNKKR
jgi:Na+-translocating ferredoxin:NAD+ oxidoreductase RnfE subunit